METVAMTKNWRIGNWRWRSADIAVCVWWQWNCTHGMLTIGFEKVGWSERIGHDVFLVFRKYPQLYSTQDHLGREASGEDGMKGWEEAQVGRRRMFECFILIGQEQPRKSPKPSLLEGSVLAVTVHLLWAYRARRKYSAVRKVQRNCISSQSAESCNSIVLERLGGFYNIIYERHKYVWLIGGLDYESYHLITILITIPGESLSVGPVGSVANMVWCWYPTASWTTSSISTRTPPVAVPPSFVGKSACNLQQHFIFLNTTRLLMLSLSHRQVTSRLCHSCHSWPTPFDTEDRDSTAVLAGILRQATPFDRDSTPGAELQNPEHSLSVPLLHSHEMDAQLIMECRVSRLITNIPETTPLSIWFANCRDSYHWLDSHECSRPDSSRRRWFQTESEAKDNDPILPCQRGFYQCHCFGCDTSIDA